MNRRIVFGIFGVLALCVCLVGGGVYLFIRSIDTVMPAGIEIEVGAPPQVPVDEPFAVDIRVTNETTAVHTIHSIDVSDSYLAGITVTSSEPPFTDSYAVPLVGFYSYTFNQSIPIRDARQVTMVMVGEEVGTFAGQIDVCIDSGSNCRSFAVETAVGADSGR